MEEQHRILDAEAAVVPYLPPSVLKQRLNWDVFISFRGREDPFSHNFTQKLNQALLSKDLRPFMADEDTVSADTTPQSLQEAILDSAISVAIVSPCYAASRRCLDELSQLFGCRKRVIPVFYMVDPSNVRRQRGGFGREFMKLGHGKSYDDVERWRRALEMVGNISGYTYKQQIHTSRSDEVVLIRQIVQQVWSELKNNPEYVVNFAVGLDSRVDEVVETLAIHSGGVRFLGIHGTPGIGKTTLAKAVFNKLVTHFKKRCFISDVREKLAAKDGLLSVQNEVIQDFSLGNATLAKQVDEGKEAIKRIVKQNRFLLVLDDVYEAQILENLGIIRKDCEDGSRIIFTSRIVGALHSLAGNDELYEAIKLDALEALELFSIHALGRREPTQEFRYLSEEIVSLADGLPLALEVFGSSLVKKTKKEWEDALIKLRLIRPLNIQMVLKWSYDGLDNDEKTVFLDISCLLLQMKLKREDVVDILAGCDLSAELAIGNLASKSLLKIMEDGRIRMHDQIRDMGRQIVREESYDDTGKRSRLWDSNDILRVLRQEKVTEAVRGIVLLDIKKPPELNTEMTYWIFFRMNPKISTFRRYLIEKLKTLLWWYRVDENDNTILHTKWLEKMVHLKLLQLDYAKLQGDFRYMPSNIRWLQWKGCPRKTLPTNMPEEIRVLDLSGSNIEHLWNPKCSCWSFGTVVKNLIVLNLSNCPRLSALPDMSGHRHLKKLKLEHCVGLTHLHESIGNLTSLVYLNLQGCTSLLDFPRDVTGMKNLKEFILSECSSFRRLPEDLQSMTSLSELLLDKTPITDLPKSIFHLTQLKLLNLNSCEQITWLPDSLGSLTSLKELILSGTKLEKLPSSAGYLIHLKKLNLMHCSFLTTLPDSVGNAESLTELYLYGSSIKQLPASIGSLTHLRVLSLGRCRSLIELPVSFKGLASIVELNLDNTPIKVLPEEICSLKFLKKMHMSYCSLLEVLPESMGKMSSLTILLIVGAAITQLPESIGQLENLTWLNVNQCKRLQFLPSSFGNLRSLSILMMEETSITYFPDSFGLLNNLSVLKMKKLPSDNLPRFRVLPDSFGKLSNLKEFDARSCGISGKLYDDFSEFSKLEVLDLGYNNFHSLPRTLEGLYVLKKLVLRHCEKLKVLPSLPSTLEELNAADCHSLETVNDLSNLERLKELQLVNCNEINDVPGLQCLKSLRRLFMGGCNKSAPAVGKRLSKVALRNLRNLSVPGREIPGWFSQTPVSFVGHPNLAIKSVIIAVVVSVDIQSLDAMRTQLPNIVDIQASIVRDELWIFRSVLNLAGLPRTREEQLYLCRFKEYHSLVSLLKEGDIIHVGFKSESVNGLELRKWGIHLVFENDDDFDGDEHLLPLDETQQSLSHRLVRFFQSMYES